MQPAQIIAIAAGAHEINRAYCLALGDASQLPWGEAPEWQMDSAIKGVEFHLANPDADASTSHTSWFAHKIANGWRYGAVKDAAKKEHPCLVPFNELPREQQAKDHLFKAAVHILAAQQHRRIAGYRELAPYEVALMNRIKAHGNETHALLDEVQRHVAAQFAATYPTYAEPTADADAETRAFEATIGTDCIDTPEQTAAKHVEIERLKQTNPFRWHAIAGTHMQEGLMALTRAVAQPTTF